MWMMNWHTRRCSASSVIKGMQTETTRCHHTSTRMVTIKNKNCKQTKFLVKRSEWTKNYDIFIPGNYTAIKTN